MAVQICLLPEGTVFVVTGHRIAMSIEMAEQIADGFLRLGELTALVQGPPWIDRCQV
jgi:hypothetical protein